MQTKILDFFDQKLYMKNLQKFAKICKLRKNKMNGKLKSGLKVKFIKLNLKMRVKNGDNRLKALDINQWRISFRHYKEDFHSGDLRSARGAK